MERIKLALTLALMLAGANDPGASPVIRIAAPTVAVLVAREN